MKRVVVVGSGASGTHFALTAAKKGHDVLMLDIGHRGSEPVNPSDDFATLKRTLPDPVRYFLGDKFQAVLFPDSASEYYGIPPTKEFVFKETTGLSWHSSGFSPLLSFGRGGLAEAWTAGVYPFNDNELSTFPFGYEDLRPHYVEVGNRIGINGSADDLIRFFPMPGELQQPLNLDEHSAVLMNRYMKTRRRMNHRLGCYFGRSRIAVLSRDIGDRKACDYLGRCLWGCPKGALYTPSQTLKECQRYPNFRYQPATRVRHFVCGSDRRVSEVICENTTTLERIVVPVDILALAAGTLMSSKIFLESLRRATGENPRLVGLMDNRQIMVPFVNLRMVGRRAKQTSYQYHQLALGFELEEPHEYVHSQITTLKSALIHPIVQSAPFNLRTSLFLFRHLHAALGLANVNLCDNRRVENFVELEPQPVESEGKLVIRYAPSRDEHNRIRQAVQRVKQALRTLGCIVPPGTTRVRPMGASVHYAGTVPMSKETRPLTTAPNGRSRDFPNLLFVDGTSFPFLPAKNLTYTLMANAVRIAELAL